VVGKVGWRGLGIGLCLWRGTWALLLSHYSTYPSSCSSLQTYFYFSSNRLDVAN